MTLPTHGTGPAASGTPILTAENLVVSYGEIHALAGVSLAVGQGEAVAVMGASGSGKTTWSE